MSNFNTCKAAFCLLVGAMLLTCCTHPEEPDDFTKLRTFEAEVSHSARLGVEFSNGHVASMRIQGRGMNQLPKSIYQFKELNELAFEETAFTALPDLKPFSNLRILTISNNEFRGPVHPNRLPSSIETLTLSRDRITEVVEDGVLPNLSWLDITHNSLKQVTPSFCTLPSLENLVISSGCCMSEAQEEELRNAAKKILCKKDVGVQTRSSID